MAVQDSLSKSNRQDDERIQIPWDITPMYDNDQGRTIINIMNINTHQENAGNNYFGLIFNSKINLEK